MKSRIWAQTGEKPPTVNVNAGEAGLDREATRLAKPYERGISDAERDWRRLPMLVR